MIEYLIALISGLTAGIILEKIEKSPEKSLISKSIHITLLLLIFFLGFDIGRKLNIEEIFQVGQLSLIFALMTMFFSYLVTRLIFKIKGEI